MDVPITVLSSFCVLAEELHFGNAARRLRISSPSLSQQLSRLEAQIGTRLFERSPRRVELTAAGRELLPLALGARDAHRAVLDWAAAQSREGEALLRVGVVATGAGVLTTEILAAAIQRLPRLRLEMRRLGFFEAPDQLLDGEVDVAFVPAPLRLPAGIRATEVASERRVLVVASDHPMAGRASVAIGELEEETFVAPSSGDASAIDWWLVDPRPSGRSPKRGPSADDIEGILDLVAAGVGVNIAAASAESYYRREQLAFVPISDIPPASILLCTLERSANPAARAFERVALEIRDRRAQEDAAADHASGGPAV
jgi:DNA-binding transcriptional LysR family regulator